MLVGCKGLGIMQLKLATAIIQQHVAGRASCYVHAIVFIPPLFVAITVIL